MEPSAPLRPTTRTGLLAYRSTHSLSASRTCRRGNSAAAAPHSPAKVVSTPNSRYSVSESTSWLQHE